MGAKSQSRQVRSIVSESFESSWSSGNLHGIGRNLRQAPSAPSLSWRRTSRYASCNCNPAKLYLISALGTRHRTEPMLAPHKLPIDVALAIRQYLLGSNLVATMLERSLAFAGYRGRACKDIWCHQTGLGGCRIPRHTTVTRIRMRPALESQAHARGGTREVPSGRE